MRKMLRTALLLLIAACAFRVGSAMKDRQLLREQVIRLHVVADSDSAEDQALKLQVRDAVTGYLTGILEDITDVEKAKEYLAQELPRLKALAERTLARAGCSDPVVVSLEEEAFDTRYYDTFTLPAGVYEALRITIGSGEGKNWWCVVFPQFCFGEEEFSDAAVGAGFPDGLSATLQGKEGYELRFWLLDWLGQLENFLRFG